MNRLIAATLVTFAVLGGVRFAVMSGDTKPDKPSKPADDKALKLPAGWNANDPLPYEKSNCVRCHLHAGRELTTPVRDFARSVHDRNHLSCNDCHGGNTDEDASAHEPQFDFIGTKMSAHMTACAGCHTRQAAAFRKSKHYWDLSKSINRKYPVCIDCHGNHDVGKPPAEFTLTNVCSDCHKQFATDMPQHAAVVAENDRLWQVLRKVHAKNKKDENPTPEEFQNELEGVRMKTARLMHHASPLSADEAKALNNQVRHLREGLETWLKKEK
ncbi:MAG TPA: cytochrome c3 family protein [Gemmataceae bacterium]|nr:cytochrome c3 family protein [Gemmataceae bacterium]